MLIKVKKLHTDSQLPTKGSKYAAGFDLYSYQNVTLKPHTSTKVDTGICIQINSNIDENYYLRIAPRSGLSSKGIHVSAGVVDQDYTGEIKCVLLNITDQEYQISKGDRIAQIIPTKYLDCPIEEVNELTQYERGDQGFGSTGK